MIDLHSHILPAVDDGSQDWDTSLAMMAIAEEAGTKIIVATPHSHEFWSPKPSASPSELVPQLVKEANQRAQQAGLQIAVLPGQECMIAHDLVADLKTGKWLTLGTSRTVLLEFPFSMWPNFVDSMVFDLQVAGYTILLAHVERYKAVQNDPNLLLPLIERGVYTQINTTSILGRFGARAEKTAQQLLEHNLAHVIASDAHTTRGRRPGLQKARDQAATWIGEAAANKMCSETPQALVRGEAPPVPTARPVEAPKKRRKRFFGWF